MPPSPKNELEGTTCWLSEAVQQRGPTPSKEHYENKLNHRRLADAAGVLSPQPATAFAQGWRSLSG